MSENLGMDFLREVAANIDKERSTKAAENMEYPETINGNEVIKSSEEAAVLQCLYNNLQDQALGRGFEKPTLEEIKKMDPDTNYDSHLYFPPGYGRDFVGQDWSRYYIVRDPHSNPKTAPKLLMENYDPEKRSFRSGK